MCGLFLWGFAWILPLVGLVLCLGMMVWAFRGGSSMRGCRFTGRRGTADD